MTINQLSRTIFGTLLFIFILITSGPSNAKTWYFAPTGSDSGSGSSSSPWLNPGAHNGSYGPGDILTVAAGTYKPVWGWQLTASGSATGGYITLQCWRNFASHVVVTSNGVSGIAITHGASYWDIRGCDVLASGANDGGISVTGQLVAPFGPLHHIIIEGNSVHGASCDGIGAAGSTNIDGDISYPVDYITISDNNVYSNGFTSGYHCSGISVYEPIAYDTLTGYHIVIQGNVVDWNNDCDNCGTKATDGNGIILDDFKYTQNRIPGYTSYTPSTLIADNVVYNNGGKGIHVFESQNATVSSNAVWGNNTDAEVCTGGNIGGYEIGTLYSSNVTITGNRGQTFSATCGGNQVYAFGDVSNGTTSSDTFTSNTGLAIVGTNSRVGYSAAPPSSYYSALSNFSFGSTNK